jgi:hypothetical protein
MVGSAIGRLEVWYAAECNGEWEHTYGIVIETLDNPGWRLRVDLAETTLQDVAFTAVNRETSPQDWIDCRVKDGGFQGHGGAGNLEEIITIFLGWAESYRGK